MFKLHFIITIILFSLIFLKNVEGMNKYSSTVRLHEAFLYEKSTWVERIEHYQYTTSEDMKQVCMIKYEEDTHKNLCDEGWETKTHSLNFEVSAATNHMLFLKCARLETCTTTY